MYCNTVLVNVPMLCDRSQRPMYTPLIRNDHKDQKYKLISLIHEKDS